MCGTPFANVLHAFAKRAAGERAAAEEREAAAIGEEETKGEAEESVFLVDPPRRPRRELRD